MGKLLSVSVASYKVEDYIRRTLESCVIPEFMDKLEVLVIVDGVCDRTPEIALEFEEKYPDTFRVIEKENGGYGTTVNRGVDEASGKYFKLLDGDDTFDKKGLTRLIRELEDTDADWIISAKRLIQEKDGISKVSYPVSDDLVDELDGQTLRAETIDFDIYSSMWNNTVRTEILKKHLPELPGGCQYTDELFNTYFLPFVKKVKFVLEPVYEYLLRYREPDDETKKKNLENFIFIRKKELKFFGKVPKTKNHRTFKYRIKTYYQRLLMAVLSMKPSKEMYVVYRQLESYCKRVAPEIYDDAVVGGKKIEILRKTGYNYWVFLIFAKTVKDYIMKDKVSIE